MEDKNNLESIIRDCGMLPIESSALELKTVVMDVNLLPSEYKEETVKASIEKYEKDFNVKIIPIDGSRQNMQGISINTIVQLY